MIRYAITDGARFGGDLRALRAGLLADARRWAAEAVEFVQLREKTLAAGMLCDLAREMVTVFAAAGGATRLLVNGRADVGAAAGAAGVHLTSGADELRPAEVRAVFAQAGWPGAVVGVSCHAEHEVGRAAEQGADLIVFGPVFGKTAGGVDVVPAAGLDALRAACGAAGSVPVLALGGVTHANVRACMTAGASGVAGIRLFAAAESAVR